MYCGECGSYLSPEDKFCGNCGCKTEVELEKEEHNKDYDNVLYSYHGITIALLSKLAKVDGRVCEKEANFIKNTIEYFSFHTNKNRFLDSYDKKIININEIYKEIVKKEKHTISNIEDLCSNLNNYNVYTEQKKELITKLVDLAHIDDTYSEKEENFIIKILNIIHFDHSQYNEIVKKHSKKEKQKEYKYQEEKKEEKTNKKKKDFNGNLSLAEAYEVLELKESASNSEIKQQFRKFSKQYHTDSLTSKDLPKDLIDFAEEKMKMINSAYETIKNSRGR